MNEWEDHTSIRIDLWKGNEEEEFHRTKNEGAGRPMWKAIAMFSADVDGPWRGKRKEKLYSN